MFLSYFCVSLNDVNVASRRIMVRCRPTNPHWTRLARPVRSREHSWRFQIHLHLVLPSGQANVEVEQEMPHEQRPMHLGRHSPFFITPRRLILLCLFHSVFVCLFLWFGFGFSFCLFILARCRRPSRSWCLQAPKRQPRSWCLHAIGWAPRPPPRRGWQRAETLTRLGKFGPQAAISSHLLRDGLRWRGDEASPCEWEYLIPRLPSTTTGVDVGLS